MLSAKAWNGRIVCAWLADVMEEASSGYDPSYDDGRLVLAVHAVPPVSYIYMKSLFCNCMVLEHVKLEIGNSINQSRFLIHHLVWSL